MLFKTFRLKKKTEQTGKAEEELEETPGERRGSGTTDLVNVDRVVKGDSDFRDRRLKIIHPRVIVGCVDWSLSSQEIESGRASGQSRRRT